MSLFNMLDLWHSPYVLLLPIYGWAVVVKGQGGITADVIIFTLQSAVSKYHCTGTHTLSSAVCDQGHCPSNPDPYCHVAPATQLQMSVSAGLHSNQLS